MTIYGVRYCDGVMMRFFSTEEQAREFIAHQEYSPTCYNVEALSEVDARSVPKDLLERGCVNREDLLAYQWGRKLYAWEILRAERIPDPLVDFRYWKAPRSWCYIEDVEVCDRRQW